MEACSRANGHGAIQQSLKTSVNHPPAGQTGMCNGLKVRRAFCYSRFLLPQKQMP